MRANRWLWISLALIVVVTTVGQVLVPFAAHVDDMGRLLNGAQSLVTGKPPGDLLTVYPASSAVQFVPLALLPRLPAEVLLRIACVALIGWIVVSYARSDRGRLQPWALVLLVSPPVIDLVRLDQFNTALALFALILSDRLLHTRRPLFAGLVAGVAMSRPFAAAPVIAGLIAAQRWRAAFTTALGTLLFVGATVGIAFAWDHNLIHDFVTTSARRTLVGPIGMVRHEFGLAGVIAALTLIAALSASVLRAGRARRVDAFVAILALSCLGVHLGGPYVAVFALPGLARLSATVSPWWATGFTLGYATLETAATLNMSAVALPAFVLAPLVCAVLPMWLLHRQLGVAPHADALDPLPLTAPEAA